ncbi:hypothetical protein M409DRAFT_69920 [Zasmidium cellare ATCC 36951]|uniref:Ams2/SPT21 N-terminal domain-containing protein n=1 Tax=Zasmidium cellare ATCC 36951 TaxID=1080233 RepID=A0A6A6C2R1_ZASCE|nr:uncharacterized protein M409DRAFT_69920 [Zasmidium cellare ATCC 36951]KAF2161331.1 hypothetical protein M409DRAFT_69920 [Zasmidium cellare ATCC 36951]
MDFGDGGDGGSLEGIPTRPMRVKVLYTFDAENKTQCLARLQDTMNIPVVAVDEQSQVGVIDLQQCIQAMLSASPEILSKLETGDFTVYNFDFTEHDAPLVGQGRLSSLLDGSSGQGKTNIIGRVCKNIQALFSGGVKEILEVKFRLTPLSRPSQGEYGRSTEALRSSSPATSSGFDPNAWNGAMQQNKVTQQSNDYFNFDAMATGGDDGAVLLEDMFGMASGATGDVSGIQQPSGVGVPETPTDSVFAYNPAFSAQSHSAPGSRAGSPIMRPGSSTHNEQIRHHSFSTQPPNFADQNRPGSRASVRSETNTSRQPYPFPPQPQQQHIQPQNEVHYNEDGQPRKRAKVIQTDWRGKSSFGSKSADLRVTAATASSMHMHRPIAKRSTGPGADLEPPPRVPTPVPQRTLHPRQRSLQPVPQRSMLRQASMADSDFGSDIEPFSDTMTSPEGSSPANSITADGTPMDIPSSPPLVPGFNQPAPSSPGLPTLPPARMADSGYMSERGFNSGNVMESLEDDENRSPDADDMEVAAHYRSRHHRQEAFFKTEGSVAGDLPYSMDGLPQSDIDAKSHGQTPQPDANASRRGSLALPFKPPPRASSQAQVSKAPAKPPRQPLHRSHTTSNASEAGSPAPSDTEGKPRGAYRQGPRRKIIEQRLQESIARGESPVFCVHCGAIETPTWRKMYVKEVDGKPGPLDEVEGEGETIGIENMEKDEDGEVIKFRIRKSVKAKQDSEFVAGFEQVIVCNPCGLWFKKFRSMRPSDRWHRKPSARKSRKPKGDDNLATDGAEPQSEAFFTDQIAPEDAVEDSNSADDTQKDNTTLSQRNLAPLRPRANSVQPQPARRTSDNINAGQVRRNAAMSRDVQSSPVRTQGSQDSPIELDLTPQPTRRLLFPSPRQAGETKSLEDGANRGSASPKANASGEKPSLKVVGVVEETTVNVNVFEAFTSDKENMAPPLNDTDDLSHLFEGSPGALFKTPLRKTPSKNAFNPTNDLLKTPTQSSRKRKPLTPSQNAANNADMNGESLLTSPSQSRYFLRSTPSRLERTPGGRSVSGGNQLPGDGISPFSRHIAQMLSDANGMGEAFTSPSRQYDFSDMPTFTTPGRDQVDWKGLDEILNSDFANYDENGGHVDGQQS